MNNHSIAFQFWLELKRKHKIYGILNHEMIIADIEELLNQQAAQQYVQRTADKRREKGKSLGEVPSLSNIGGVTRRR